MNYEPNTRKWEPGELVLHDADAKTVEMLMVVIDYNRDGTVRTRYRNPAVSNRQIWVNDLRVLHDPARFGVAVPE